MINILIILKVKRTKRVGGSTQPDRLVPTRTTHVLFQPDPVLTHYPTQPA